MTMVVAKGGKGTRVEVPQTTSAYAKIVGKGFSHYITTDSVSLGRQTSTRNKQPDIVVGSGRSLSRLHGRIFLDPPCESFLFSCLTKNGAFVDGQFITSENGPVTLHSQSLIQMGNTFVYFLLPGSNKPPQVTNNPAPSVSQDAAFTSSAAVFRKKWRPSNC